MSITLEEEAILFTKQLYHTYLVERDINKILPQLASEISWIGTGKCEICNGHKEAKILLELEFQQWQGNFKVLEEWYEAVAISENSCVVLGEMSIQEDDDKPILIEMNIRFTAVCKKGIDGMRMYHIHYSTPNSQQGFDEFIPQKLTYKYNLELRKMIDKKTQELEELKSEFKESEKRYKFALEVTNDVVFEVDLLEDKVVIDQKKVKEFFGFYLNISSATDAARIAYDFVHPNDRKKVIQKFNTESIEQCVEQGENFLTMECQIKNKDNQYIWALIKIIPIKGKDNNIAKVIGNIRNIDRKKKEALKVKQLIQTDPLTGVYNKRYIEDIVDETFKRCPDKSAVIMVIDVDEFKKINDTLGHLKGDTVLVHIATKLKEAVGKKGSVGRVGGDEFVAFIKEPLTYIEIAKVAHEMLLKMNKYSISGSIGIAKYPQDGENYKKLFKNADRALYEAKKQGKNCFKLYQGKIKQEGQNL